MFLKELFKSDFQRIFVRQTAAHSGYAATENALRSSGAGAGVACLNIVGHVAVELSSECRYLRK